MTTQPNLEQEGKFVRTLLPWLIAATGLLVYLLTLNHWIAFGSLQFVSRATGETWIPELTGAYGNFGPNGPLLFLVTYPIRWLPEPWIPLALNLFSSLCAVLVLALLARSVALLPHDRTHDQRERELYGITLASLKTAWIPSVLAVVVCGLQLAFWERATSMSGDMFELLLFAYVVRCLLEFRLEERDSWLFRAALVYGAAMTGNWFMVALVPWFIVSLLWLKGISFFNLRFLGFTLLFSLVGLLFYLLLPLIYVMSDSATVGFWQALKVNLMTQKNLIMYISQAFRGNDNDLLVKLILASLTSFLPVMLIAIRWASHFGDPSPIGTALTTGVFHLAHAALFAACVWVSFDPSFSPGHINPLNRIPSLCPVLSYLSALSAGYLCGYFLLVFIPVHKRMHQESFWLILFNRAAQTLIWTTVFLVPCGLVFKNLPSLRLTNGRALQHYVSLLAQNLPEHTIVLSDDNQKLSLARAWLVREGKAQSYVFLDTKSLILPDYHRYLNKRHPQVWQIPADLKNDQPVPDGYLMNLINQLSTRYPVYYLHPSFGYYFEIFYPKPHGLVYEMRPYPTNVISMPPLAEAEIAGNESFWNEVKTTAEPLIPFINQPSQGKSTDLRTLLMEKLRVPFEPNITALYLGMYYSQGLNVWGIHRQKAGQLKEAGEHFSSAVLLNPENVSAKANKRFNEQLLAGQTPAIETIKSFDDEFGKYRNPEQVLRNSGPFDDPTHGFMQARLFADARLLRQAAVEFERVNELVPDNVTAQYWYARLLTGTRFPDKALGLIAKIRARPNALEGTGIRKLDIAQIESVALLSVNKPLEAEQVLQDIMNQNPESDETLAMVFQISNMFGRNTNALSAVERQLKLKPNDTVALVNLGFLHLQIGAYDQAIPPLTRALTIETNNYYALLDRAIAYLQTSKLDEAQKDYSTLLKVFPNDFRVHYGLGEIAWRKHDTNAAIHSYEQFIANSPPDTDDAKITTERLKALKGDLPKDDSPKGDSPKP